MRKNIIIAVLSLGALFGLPVGWAHEEVSMSDYEQLVRLFSDWRAFERPALHQGAPDYRQTTLSEKHRQLANYRKRLAAIDGSQWSVEQRVDIELVRAEFNGFDFYVRVLQPWARDPAFYQSLWTAQSDTPAHEGPTHDRLIELWTYQFPLDSQAQARLAAELAIIPPLLEQAQLNLTGNARDLWMAGIGTIKTQIQDLRELAERTGKDSRALRQSVSAALQATESFVGWLEQQAPQKDGPSGVGKENYSWHLRHVLLVPMSWEEEVTLLKRELARAHSGLRMEEARNRGLPPLPVIGSAEEYNQRGNAAVSRWMKFLAEREILTVKDYMDPALRAQLGGYVPIEQRNFFAIATHYEPLTLYTHFYHWWDLAQMRDEPHANPIRRGPLLYNIWVSRAEGMATAMEEMMLQAGLYDEQPRAREIVWIMLAQRAARGLASLYAQSNDFSMKQAADFHVAWTPRGWMRDDLDLLGFEQQLYLRQPGYGTSYITGKYLLEELMTRLSHQQGEKFSLRGYYDGVNAVGMIPVQLIEWQMTGKN